MRIGVDAVMLSAPIFILGDFESGAGVISRFIIIICYFITKTLYAFC